MRGGDGAVRVAITGGSGFLGAGLARRLLAAGTLTVDGTPERIEELLLADIALPPADLLTDVRVRAVIGPLEDLAGEVAAAQAVFHLAGVVSGAAEADFDLGMATNVDATRALLEACRARGSSPVVVFSSSLAVFGADEAVGPVGVVDDDTLPRPQSSYGVQKFVAEQFVADYTRKGFLRGRSVRLMTVAVRPGAPNAAASGFLSGIIREPLAGLRATCPVDPGTAVAISSPRRTLDGLLAAAGATGAAWGSRTAMNLPSLTVTPAAMVEALARVAGPERASLIDWVPDPAVAAIVGSWPAVFRTDRAARLGLLPEESFDEVIRSYIAEHPDAVAG
jgi:nucleoside-diphosphate-sugar epimerase